MTNVALNNDQVKAKLEELRQFGIDYITERNLSVSDVVKERTREILEIYSEMDLTVSPDEELPMTGIAPLLDIFKENPDKFLEGSIIRDGVIYPQIEDEDEAKVVMDQLKKGFSDFKALCEEDDEARCFFYLNRCVAEVIADVMLTH